MMENLPDLLDAFPLTAAALVFLAGAISSASPCALIMVPLAVGYVGGHAEGDRRRTFGYSLAFILGLTLIFTSLGAAAALLGRLMGSLGGPWYLALGLLAAGMGLHQMGLIRLRLPTGPAWRPRRTWALGAFLLGALFGLLSSPCATPVLAALLGLVATQGQVGYGIALLFVYALGHCLLMLAAGTFTGLVQAFAQAHRLTRLADWLNRGLAVLLLADGGWFVTQA